LKIAQINTFDIIGGASRAAYRLQKGLTNIGVACRMISNRKASKDENVIEAQVRNAEETFNEVFYLSAIQDYYINTHRTEISNTIFSLPYPGLDISVLPEVREADIINLHWVAWYQSPVTLKRVFSLGKPVVWTLHDQWAFTGGCHYSAGCRKYRTDCSHCPQLADDPFDLAAMVLKDKLDIFKGADLTIVTPSKWLASCVKESALFKDLRVEVIPNSLETDVFVPQPKAEAKQKIGVSPDDITILFGAEHGIEKRKGFHELVAAIQHCMSDAVFRDMVKKGTVKMLCFGNASNELQTMGLPVVSLGYLTADEALSDAYSASDFFVLPSLEDNLPNTMLESLSCATPVVAFDTGGIPDIIIEGETGRLAPKGDTIALGRAILAMIADPDLRRRMGQTGHERMIKGYSLDVQAKRYLALYEKLRAQAAASSLSKRVFSSSKEKLTAALVLDTTLGANFKSIYDRVQVKSLREAAPALQKQFAQCSQLKTGRESTIEQQSARIKKISGALNERTDQLRQAADRIKERNDTIMELHATIGEKARQLALAENRLTQSAKEIDQLGTQIKEKEEQFKTKCLEVASKDQEFIRVCEEHDVERVRLDEEFKLLQEEIRQRKGRIDDLLNSWSWKLTAPLRYILKNLKR
jgi:glycosyltransferase involved in cell wall biosynthesis